MKDNKHYIETQIVRQRFSPQEFLLIVYKPKNHELFSQKTFDDLENIRQNLLQIDRIESVRSILNVPLFLNSEQLSSQTESSDLTIKNNDYSFEELKKTFTGHPIYEDLLINKDQTATALQLLFK
ncbi:RND family transporter, partial [Patescibacteria group bacterium]|nr:RND family transporter [Patescibacteria group bacterium]